MFLELDEVNRGNPEIKKKQKTVSMAKMRFVFSALTFQILLLLIFKIDASEEEIKVCIVLLFMFVFPMINLVCDSNY